MSTERDTKFQGFANLLYQELSNLDGNGTVISEYRNKYDKQEIVQLIARRAYDLVSHTIDSLWPFLDDRAIDPSANDIPDLTEWTEAE